MPRKPQKGDLADPFLGVVRALNAKKIRFLIAGARALAFHGYSRFTRDYDLCVAPDPRTIDQALELFHGLGFQLAEPVDAMMIAQSVNIHFIGPVDVDLLIRPKGFSFEEAWKHRAIVKVSDCEISFVSRDDLILMKEAVGRPQDSLDVERLRKLK